MKWSEFSKAHSIWRISEKCECIETALIVVAIRPSWGLSPSSQVRVSCIVILGTWSLLLGSSSIDIGSNYVWMCIKHSGGGGTYDAMHLLIGDRRAHPSHRVDHFTLNEHDAPLIESADNGSRRIYKCALSLASSRTFFLCSFAELEHIQFFSV